MITLRDTVISDCLRTDGYAVARLLPPEVVERLRGKILALAETVADPWSAARPLMPNYISLMDEDTVRRNTSTELVTANLAPTIAKLFTGYKVLDWSIIAKGSGVAETSLHQHAPAVQDPFETSYLVWCALTDTDEANGAMVVVPGSQRLVRHIRTYDCSEYFSGYAIRLREEFGVTVPLKAGEALIIDDNLIHAAFANQSSSVRLAAAALVIPEESRHAVFRQGKGEILAMDPLTDGFAMAGTRDTRLRDWQSEAWQSFPEWKSTATWEQTKALLQLAGPRASAEFDPLTQFEHLAPKQASESAAPPPPGLRRALLRVPGLRTAYRGARRLGSAVRPLIYPS